MQETRHMDALATWLAATCEQITVDTVDAVIREATKGTKRSGRPDPAVIQDLVRELVQCRIGQALVEHPPTIAFRPIVHLESGEFIAHEAVARCDTTPGDRFLLHDMAGLRSDIELGAIRATLREVNHLPGATFVCVNVSPDLLSDTRLHALLDQFPCDRLVVEIDSRDEATDYRSLRPQLDFLRNRGVRVAVSGIGSGESRSARVSAFEPEIIKVDVSNAQRLASDHRQRALVSETVQMARQFGSFVVAEGIESSEQISVALQLGVDAGQGQLLDLSAMVA